MKTTMTRVGFCPKCKALGAEVSDEFIAYGQDSQLYKQVYTLYKGVSGYTPHIYQFKSLVGDTVFYTRVCSMIGCGADIIEKTVDNKPTYKMVIYKNAWSGEMPMSLRDWEALEDFTDTGFEL